MAGRPEGEMSPRRVVPAVPAPKNRTSANGSFRLDREFTRLGVGRIQLATGLFKPDDFTQLNSCVSRLAASGAIDVLRALRNREITPAELLTADKKQRSRFILLDRGEDAERHRRETEAAAQKAIVPFADRPLWATATALIAGLSCGQETRRRYATSITSLRNRDLAELKDDATFGDLYRVDWRALRDRWEHSPADWNHLRRALSRILTALTEERHGRHPFRYKLLDKIPHANEGDGRVPDLTPELFWRIVGRMPVYVQAAPVVLVLTGFRMHEYELADRSHLRPHQHLVVVPGPKTEASHSNVAVDPRCWAWIERGIPAPLGRRWLGVHWRRARDAEGCPDIRLHDLRHCLGQWTTDEGVPEKFVQSQLRHASPQMTRRYTRVKERRVVAGSISEILTKAAERRTAGAN